MTNKITKTINNKTINIITPSSSNKKLPLVVLNTFENEGDEVYKSLNKDIILLEISNLNWNADLSPWKQEAIFKNDEGFAGNGDAYLNELINTIIPEVLNDLKEYEIDNYILAGYSLAGLFALYASYNTDLFNKVVSCSGSLWYPNFKEYIFNNELNKNADSIYLSLGDKEKYTKNIYMSKVEENTLEIYKYLKNKTNIYFEFNEGNHFKNSSLRTAKGINKILE